MDFTYLIMFMLQFTLMNSMELNNVTDVNCTVYKDSFSKSVSDFTSCAISNSRPIKLCESCVDIYIDVENSHRNLTLASDVNGPCIDKYIHLDRLEIIETLHQNSYNLWNRAKCYECFQIENGSLTHNQSNETIQFNELYTHTINCIHQYVNTSDLCNKCMDPYVQLSDFYNSISNENEKIGVCMDIVDVMNSTRSFWSENCCRYRRHKEYLFMISTVCMFVVTILFYVLTKIYVDKKSPAVFMQSRFAESLNSS